ncbi:MAG TPA: hypothetical protein VG672_22700 [Bryobacteraceae bacterium]|nr:hypothetical protein [Bryobacteraceae bacterium]HWB99542.1 hypothetical protein [Bryobacteraceae bacterium]
MSSGKQMIALAIIGGVFIALLVAGIAGNVVRGNYLAFPIALLVLAFAVSVIWVSIWFNQRRVQNMFQQATPDRLIEHYHSSLLRAQARRIPNADAATADLAALAATVYGQYDRAREELAKANWDAAAPMYRARRLDVLALMALLEDRDGAAAVGLASEARALEAAPTPLRDAVLIAAGEGDAESLKRAQKVAGRVGALAAVSAWALSLYSARNGQSEGAERYQKLANRAAPHFSAAKA